MRLHDEPHWERGKAIPIALGPLPPTLGDQKRGVVGGSELVTVSNDTANKTHTHPADRYRRLLIETWNVILNNL